MLINSNNNGGALNKGNIPTLVVYVLFISWNSQRTCYSNKFKYLHWTKYF